MFVCFQVRKNQEKHLDHENFAFNLETTLTSQFMYGGTEMTELQLKCVPSARQAIVLGDSIDEIRYNLSISFRGCERVNGVDPGGVAGSRRSSPPTWSTWPTAWTPAFRTLTIRKSAVQSPVPKLLTNSNWRLCRRRIKCKLRLGLCCPTWIA